MSTLQWHSNRLASRIQREVAWLIANKVNDPRVSSMVSPVEVRLSPDNRNALIFVSVYGTDEEKAEAIVALNHARSFIQTSVAQKVKVKHFPKFSFKLDTSMDYSEKINTILKGVTNDLDESQESDSE